MPLNVLWWSNTAADKIRFVTLYEVEIAYIWKSNSGPLINAVNKCIREPFSRIASQTCSSKWKSTLSNVPKSRKHTKMCDHITAHEALAWFRQHNTNSHAVRAQSWQHPRFLTWNWNQGLLCKGPVWIMRKHLREGPSEKPLMERWHAYQAFKAI